MHFTNLWTGCFSLKLLFDHALMISSFMLTSWYPNTLISYKHTWYIWWLVAIKLKLVCTGVSWSFFFTYDYGYYYTHHSLVSFMFEKRENCSRVFYCLLQVVFIIDNFFGDRVLCSEFRQWTLSTVFTATNLLQCIEVYIEGICLDTSFRSYEYLPHFMIFSFLDFISIYLVYLRSIYPIFSYEHILLVMLIILGKKVYSYFVVRLMSLSYLQLDVDLHFIISKYITYEGCEPMTVS